MPSSDSLSPDYMKFNYCIPARLMPTQENVMGITGFTMINVFPDDHHYHIVLTVTLMGVIMMFLSLWVVFPQIITPQFGGRNPSVGGRDTPPSTVRVAVGFYLFWTGVFSFLLATGVNKISLLAAAIHNWSEWLLIAHLYTHNDDQRKKFVAAASFFIWCVMYIILIIPDIINAFLFEECVGLWPDLQLMFAAWSLSRQFGDYELDIMEDRTKGHYTATPWLWFKIGASGHLLQIFTLLFMGGGFLPAWPHAQGLLMFSTIPNYVGYALFALEYDFRYHNVCAKLKQKAGGLEAPPMDASLITDFMDAEKLLDYMDKGDKETPPEYDTSRIFDGKRHKKSAWKSMFTKSQLKFAISTFFLSCTFVLGPMYLVGDCVEVAKSARPTVRVTHYPMKKYPASMQDALYAGVLEKRRAPGNIVARLYENTERHGMYGSWLTPKPQRHADEYVVFEWWEDDAEAQPPIDVRGYDAPATVLWQVLSDKRADTDYAAEFGGTSTLESSDVAPVPLTWSERRKEKKLQRLRAEKAKLEAKLAAEATSKQLRIAAPRGARASQDAAGHVCSSYPIVTGFEKVNSKEYELAVKVKVVKEAAIARSYDGNLLYLPTEKHKSDQYFMIWETWIDEWSRFKHSMHPKNIRFKMLSKYSQMTDSRKNKEVSGYYELDKKFC